MIASGFDFDYLALGILFCVGLYMLVAKSHLLKKLLGLNVMSTSVFGFIVTSGMIEGGSAPILGPMAEPPFVSPIPHAMVLTGIVVSVSVTAVALALILQIHAHFGTLEVDELKERP